MTARINKHIGIIGAGFAGMAAALELHDLGFKVTVLEARDRVGGRVWSTTLSNDEIAELGGEWIKGRDNQVLGMIDRLGLSKAEVGVNFLERKVIVGEPVSKDEQEGAHDIAEKTLASMNKDDIKSRSIGEFINALPLNEPQKIFFYSRLQTSFGIDLNKVALRMIEDMDGNSPRQTANYRGGSYFRVASGNMSIAQAIADKLDDVRLGHEAILAEQKQKSVTIRGKTSDGPFQLELDAVVFAIPVNLLADIEFVPALPNPIKNAINSVTMGTAAKITAATKERPTLRAYHDSETPYWCWTGRGGDSNVRKVITAFCGSATPREKLGLNSNDPNIWYKELKSMNPDLDFEGDAIMVDWSREKWTQGCYSAFSNEATDNIPYLKKSVESIFFAGEHTAFNSATMDGAIESGLRAANQVYKEFR
ncbi:MAG: NAD(P)/FAD-dependent oxidoreductase [Anaerolineae bacterium]|nr:NAD(P)/FAD-dependent oxidoreductase [Anaerolineae bacterium]